MVHERRRLQPGESRLWWNSAPSAPGPCASVRWGDITYYAMVPPDTTAAEEEAHLPSEMRGLRVTLHPEGLPGATLAQISEDLQHVTAGEHRPSGGLPLRGGMAIGGPSWRR